MNSYHTCNLWKVLLGADNVDDLDAGQVALMHGAVEGLPGEGLAVQRTVGIAVEETANLVFELPHPLDRGRQTLHEQPSNSGPQSRVIAIKG